jgi:hypothetical protein
MNFDQRENHRKAISGLKTRIEQINRILDNTPKPGTIGPFGQPIRVSQRSIGNLIRERLRHEAALAELEAEDRLVAPMASSKKAIDIVWEQIDHRLVGLKLMQIAEDMLRIHQDDLARIRHENRLNSNTYSELQQRVRANLERLDECAERYYQAYCDTWAAQGKRKSAAFVRCVYQRAIMELFAARVSAVKSELASESMRTNRWENNVLNATFTSFDREVERLKARWVRKLEIEAIGCEYSESKSELVGVQKAEHVEPVAQEKVEKTVSSSVEPTSNSASNQGKGEADIREVAPGVGLPLVDMRKPASIIAKETGRAALAKGAPYRGVPNIDGIMRAVKDRKATGCTYREASMKEFGNRKWADRIRYWHNKLARGE